MRGAPAFTRPTRASHFCGTNVKILTRHLVCVTRVQGELDKRKGLLERRLRLLKQERDLLHALNVALREEGTIYNTADRVRAETLFHCERTLLMPPFLARNPFGVVARRGTVLLKGVSCWSRGQRSTACVVVYIYNNKGYTPEKY